jgi:hypothetical protein
MKLLITEILQPSVTSSLLGPNIFLNAVFPNVSNLCSFFYVSNQVSCMRRIRQNYTFDIFQSLRFWLAKERQKTVDCGGSKNSPNFKIMVF